MCKFESEDGGTSWNETAKVFLFIVTPHGDAVDVGDSATLSCVITGKVIVGLYYHVRSKFNDWSIVY